MKIEDMIKLCESMTEEEFMEIIQETRRNRTKSASETRTRKTRESHTTKEKAKKESLEEYLKSLTKEERKAFVEQVKNENSS